MDNWENIWRTGCWWLSWFSNVLIDISFMQQKNIFEKTHILWWAPTNPPKATWSGKPCDHDTVLVKHLFYNCDCYSPLLLDEVSSFFFRRGTTKSLCGVPWALGFSKTIRTNYGCNRFFRLEEPPMNWCMQKNHERILALRRPARSNMDRRSNLCSWQDPISETDC